MLLLLKIQIKMAITVILAFKHLQIKYFCIFCFDTKDVTI